MAERPSREQRHDGDRQEQRQQHRDREAHRQRAEELTRDAGQQAERRKHDHRRQRGARQRRHQLLDEALDDVLRPFGRASMELFWTSHGPTPRSVHSLALLSDAIPAGVSGCSAGEFGSP